MAAGEMTIKAEGTGRGRVMSMEDVERAFTRARAAGFNRLVKTTVSWGGQIQSMTFAEGWGGTEQTHPQTATERTSQRPTLVPDGVIPARVLGDPSAMADAWAVRRR
jgi:hypothetical protein